MKKRTWVWLAAVVVALGVGVLAERAHALVSFNVTTFNVWTPTQTDFESSRWVQARARITGTVITAPITEIDPVNRSLLTTYNAVSIARCYTPSTGGTQQYPVFRWGSSSLDSLYTALCPSGTFYTSGGGSLDTL